MATKENFEKAIESNLNLSNFENNNLFQNCEIELIKDSITFTQSSVNWSYGIYYFDGSFSIKITPKEGYAWTDGTKEVNLSKQITSYCSSNISETDVYTSTTGSDVTDDNSFNTFLKNKLAIDKSWTIRYSIMDITLGYTYSSQLGNFSNKSYVNDSIKKTSNLKNKSSYEFVSLSYVDCSANWNEKTFILQATPMANSTWSSTKDREPKTIKVTFVDNRVSTESSN